MIRKWSINGCNGAGAIFLLTITSAYNKNVTSGNDLLPMCRYATCHTFHFFPLCEKSPENRFSVVCRPTSFALCRWTKNRRPNIKYTILHNILHLTTFVWNIFTQDAYFAENFQKTNVYRHIGLLLLPPVGEPWIVGRISNTSFYKKF